MIKAIIDQMIGPWGRAILDFYFSHQSIINTIFLIWAGFMTVGSVQLDRVRRLTVKLSLEALKKNPNYSDEQIWQEFRPVWETEIATLGTSIILNRWNVWVTKPTPEKLIELLRLGPDWFAAIRNGEVLRYRFSLPGKNDRLKSF